MPTYKNTTNVDKMIGYNTIVPNGILTDETYHKNLPEGVVIIDEFPIRNDLVYSNIIKLNKGESLEIVIPDSINNTVITGINLRIYCRSGESSIKFNTDLMAPFYTIGPGFELKKNYEHRCIERILITATGEFTDLDVLIEKNR